MIILTILINCVFLALDDPVDELEYVFTAIYTLEVVIKVSHILEKWISRWMFPDGDQT